MSDLVLSPTQSDLRPFPQRSDSADDNSSTSQAQDVTQSGTPSDQPQTAPRTRGGFEIEEDRENEDEEEDGQDDDVYDPEFAGQEYSPEYSGNSIMPDQIDRNSQSPHPENGITPVPAQANDSPADISTSAVPQSSSANGAAVAARNATPTTAPAPSVSSDLTSVLPKSRLAHDVVGILEDRIKDDPRGDTAAWLELIDELKGRNKDSEARQTYQRYLDTFPLAAEQWCAFVRWEEENDRKYAMEEIFRKALLQVPDIQLWSIYINYVRRRNSMQTGNTAKAYQIINQAFDFALQRVGMDKDSGKLWTDYIDFLKSGPGAVGGSGWQDNQKMDTLREAYRKALAVPTSALQNLWKDYDSFETGINKINGRKFLQERSPDYMTARGAYTQMQNLTRDLQRTSRPRLPPAMGYEGDVEYQQQVALWKQWVRWEVDDNLSLKDDKPEVYKDRVVFTFKQALMALQFWPEMWYDAAGFCFSNDRDEEGLSFLQQGFAANPESPLLAFKLADHLESTSSNDDTADPGSKNRMKKVREPFDQVLDALYAVDRKTEARMLAEVQRVEESAARAENGGIGGEDDLNASNIGARKAATDAQVEAVKTSARAHLEMLSRVISHVWIALMRATRRIQGKGLPHEKGAGFRLTFNEARKRGRLTPDFYVETAQIEWQCYRDATGTRILERGVKLFPEDAYLPLEYIKHLINKDDMTNARAVFETTVSRFTSANNPASTAKAKPLFVFFHDYESKYGELSQIVRLETRMRELFPEDPMLEQFAARYRTPGFDPMRVSPIVSTTQLQPKTLIHPSIEISEVRNSPIQKVIDHITTTNSPKRALPFEDREDSQPRKMARGESPLKGAAGRRINQQQQLQQHQQPASSTQSNRPNASYSAPAPAPAPLPSQLLYLLSILPKASFYNDTRFDPVKIHQLIRDVHLPPPGSIGAPRPPQPPQATAAAGWPPQYAQQPPPMVPPPQGYMTPTSAQASFGQAPFRYA